MIFYHDSMKVKIIRYYQPDTTAKKFTYTSEPKCTLSPNNIDLHDVTLFCEDDSKESISDLQMPRTYVGENDAKYQKLFKVFRIFLDTGRTACAHDPMPTMH